MESYWSLVSNLRQKNIWHTKILNCNGTLYRLLHFLFLSACYNPWSVGFKKTLSINSCVPKTVRHGTSLHRIRWNYLAQVLFDSSPRRLFVNRRWNYSAQVLVDSSPRRLSVDRRWNYLAQVLVVCTSTDAETVDSHPSHISFDSCNL